MPKARLSNFSFSRKMFCGEGTDWRKSAGEKRYTLCRGSVGDCYNGVVEKGNETTGICAQNGEAAIPLS